MRAEDFKSQSPAIRRMAKMSSLNFLSCRVPFNSLQARCIVNLKARLRKVRFSGDFLEVFDFLRIACSLGIPQGNL